MLQKTAEINSALGARAAATIHSSQEISHALLEQLRALAEQGKELPGTLLDVGLAGFTSSNKELTNAGRHQGDHRHQGDRAQQGRHAPGEVEQAWGLRCGGYKRSAKPCFPLFSDVVQDQVKPVVDEIYNYVLGAKVSLVCWCSMLARCSSRPVLTLAPQKKAQDEASKAREQVNGGQ